MMKRMAAIVAAVVAGGVCAASEAVRTGNEVRLRAVRFTVLTPSLIRMEYDNRSLFEDRPSMVALKRDWSTVDFTLKEEPGLLQIDTSHLRLRYVPRSGRFNALNLRVELLRMPKPVAWRPGLKNTGNLGGTRKSLDGITGPVDVDDGILSRDGWFMLDDSRSPVVGDDGWPAVRPNPFAQDFHLFGYNTDYARGLKDYTELCGAIPLLPSWAFGIWFSPPTRLHADELLQMIGRFRQEGYPLDVLLIENWRRNGWGSYEWDPQYFPDPADFVRKAHAMGTKVALQVHPGGALLPVESRYVDVCNAVGWDPERRGMIFLDISNRKEADALVNVLLPPRQEQGIDFWWVDGTAATTIRWLPNQWWTNYLFFTHSRRTIRERTVILSRYDGPGSHRFPVMDSGEFQLNWDVLRFLTWFTPTAGNIAVPYWSHSVGGKRYPRLDDQLMVRSVQFAAFSPMLRLGMPPWLQRGAAARTAGSFLQVRRSLMPYLNSLSHTAHTEGLPLCRPMYLRFPQDEQAYGHKHQYLLGSDMLVAPVTEPGAGENYETTREIWFPPKTWYDFFTGRIVEGPITLNYPATADEVPVFAQAGAIIPLAPAEQPREAGLENMILNVYSGSPGSFVLYGDTGAGVLRAIEKPAESRITYLEDEHVKTVRIGQLPEGAVQARVRRRYEIRLATILPVEAVEVNCTVLPHLAGRAGDTGWYFDPELGIAVARTPPLRVSEPAEVTFRGNFDRDFHGLAYRLREIVPRLESAAILLRRTKGAQEIAQRLRAAEKDAITFAENLCRKPPTREELEDALATVRGDVAETVGLANAGIRNDALKLEFMRIVTGIDIECKIIPGQFRCIALRNDIRFLPYGWGTLTGRIVMENVPPHPIGPLEPDDSTFMESEVEVPAIRLAELRFPVTVELEWNGLPLTLALENVLDNTFIKQFYIIGPFGDGSYRRVTEIVFPPERAIDLSATYTGKRREPVSWGKLPWQAPVASHQGQDYRFVDLTEHLTRMPAAAGYAYAQVYVPRAVEAKCLVGSEGGIVLWLNGIEIFRDPYLKQSKPGAVTVATQLRAGWNNLLVKSIDDGRNWGFHLQLVGKDGAPIPGAVSGWGEGFR